jgi:glycosyltransferase involved in cell wall biosynthesis
MKVTVVTPSFNQAAFIERTVESVLAQRGDFELEYLVVDGGSTDGTAARMEPYRDRLTFLSEPDRGQSDAINKGFARARGDVLAWLNSDDTYLPGALERVCAALRRPGARWCFGQCRVIDEADRPIRGFIRGYKNWLARRYSRRLLLTKDFIPQPATFFRRELLEQAGPLDPSLHYAMDYDLWLRFADLADPVFVPEDLACFRWHDSSKSGARYHVSALEALAAARRRARPDDRGVILRHRLHVLSLVAGYRLLDALRPRSLAAPGSAGTATPAPPGPGRPAAPPRGSRPR